MIEETYSNPAHWDQNGGHRQTEQVAWEILGTEERMAQLEELIQQAGERLPLRKSKTPNTLVVPAPAWRWSEIPRRTSRRQAACSVIAGYRSR